MPDVGPDFTLMEANLLISLVLLDFYDFIPGNAYAFVCIEAKSVRGS